VVGTFALCESDGASSTASGVATITPPRPRGFVERLSLLRRMEALALDEEQSRFEIVRDERLAFKQRLAGPAREYDRSANALVDAIFKHHNAYGRAHVPWYIHEQPGGAAFGSPASSPRAFRSSASLSRSQDRPPQVPGVSAAGGGGPIRSVHTDGIHARRDSRLANIEEATARLGMVDAGGPARRSDHADSNAFAASRRARVVEVFSPKGNAAADGAKKRQQMIDRMSEIDASSARMGRSLGQYSDALASQRSVSSTIPSTERSGKSLRPDPEGIFERPEDDNDDFGSSSSGSDVQEEPTNFDDTFNSIGMPDAHDADAVVEPTPADEREEDRASEASGMPVGGSSKAGSSLFKSALQNFNAFADSPAGSGFGADNPFSRLLLSKTPPAMSPRGVGSPVRNGAPTSGFPKILGAKRTAAQQRRDWIEGGGRTHWIAEVESRLAIDKAFVALLRVITMQTEMMPALPDRFAAHDFLR
jgi:hypothetical protein